MMSNHTPGPWKVDEMCCYIWGKDNREPFTVAEIRGWGQLTQQHKETEAIAIQEANARLIAASPELKDIVKEFVEKAVIPIRPPERDPSGEVMAVLVRQWVDDDLLNRAQSLLRRIEGEEVMES